MLSTKGRRMGSLKYIKHNKSIWETAISVNEADCSVEDHKWARSSMHFEICKKHVETCHDDAKGKLWNCVEYTCYKCFCVRHWAQTWSLIGPTQKTLNPKPCIWWKSRCETDNYCAGPWKHWFPFLETRRFIAGLRYVGRGGETAEAMLAGLKPSRWEGVGEGYPSPRVFRE